jgi:predicted regulator of Ras-like GTPase activity (Roadblock/LC7/MglB family)
LNNDQQSRLLEVLKPPISEFVREAHIRTALLINGSGQVLAQHGFTRSYEVMNVAALAAAAHAAARALAEMTEARRWAHVHHAGKQRQLFMAPIKTPLEELILVAIFDSDSSLGLVQLFFQRLSTHVGDLPELQQRTFQTTLQTFEQDLQAGLSNVLATEANGEG